MNNSVKYFKHKSAIEIRFADIDAMGHVNNAKYLTYLEEARIKYMNAVMQSPINWGQQGMILARIEYDFVRPALFGDKIFIYTCCSKIGTKSFVLEYLIVREAGNSEEIVGRSESVLVAFDYVKGHSTPIPEEWKEHLRQFEHSEQAV